VRLNARDADMAFAKWWRLEGDRDMAAEQI